MALCIVGLLLVGWAVFDALAGKIYQQWRGREVDRALVSLPAAAAAPSRHATYTPGSAIGRLEIPRIGISVVVLEGSDSGSLRLGVGRLPASALPGEPGNVVLAGHRDTFFRSLREIRPGDRISLRTTEGQFAYTVDWTQVVNPTDTGVLRPTPAPALTLVTCYPFYYIGSAPQRFIVRARPVEAAAAAETPPPPAIPAPVPVIRKAAAHRKHGATVRPAAVPVHPATLPAGPLADTAQSPPPAAKSGVRKLDPRPALHRIGALFTQKTRQD